MRIMSAFTTAFFVSRIPLLPDSALTAQRSSEDVRFMSHATQPCTQPGGVLYVLLYQMLHWALMYLELLGPPSALREPTYMP